MSVLIDIRTNGTFTVGATTLSWTHTVSAGLSNSILLVAASTGKAPPHATVSGVNWDDLGTPAALAEKGTGIAESTDSVFGDLWFLTNPVAGASKTIKITASTSCEITGSSSSYQNVDQANPFNAASPQTAIGTANPQPSLAVTSATGEMVVDAVAVNESGTSTLAQGAGQTVIGINQVGAGKHTAGSSDAPGAASVTMSWTGVTVGDLWCEIAASLKAAATADSGAAPSQRTRAGRGPGAGPSMRRMMPQQFPVVPPPPLLPAQPTPFRIGRGVSMGKPQRRMFPQRYPDTVVSSAVTAALTGVASTTGRGTVGVTHNNALAGVSTTTSAGSVKAALTKALSGVSTTTGRGTLGVAHTNALSGVASVTARGSVGSTRAVPLSGVQGTGAVGTVTATTGIVVALSGVSASLSVGTMSPSTVAAIAGVQAAGLAGNLTVSGAEVAEQPVSKFRYIIKTKGRLHKSSHREMAELLDRVFATPDEPSVPAPLAEEVRAIIQPFVYKNELHLAKLEKDMQATRKLLDLWTTETARMRTEDEDDDETVMLLS